MWNLFNKKSTKSIYEFLKSDMHSHLLPSVDDGVQDLETSINYIKDFYELGYRKLVLSPHIYAEFYPNNKADLLARFEVLKASVAANNIPIVLELAAEYFMDAHFETLLQNNELLAFGDNYLLVETSFVGLPLNFEDMLFEIVTMGYQPILAHPERYIYLARNMSYFRKLHERNVHLQVNLLSLFGYYGHASNDIVKYLLNEKLVSFIGTDLHNEKHLNLLKKYAFDNSTLKLLEKQPLLNATL